MSLVGLRSLKIAFWGLSLLAAVLVVTLFTDSGPKAPAAVVRPAPKAIAKSVQAEAPSLDHFTSLKKSCPFGTLAAVEIDRQAPGQLDLPSFEGFRLVGLMSGSEEYSFAVVEEAASGRQEMVGPGDAVGPGKVLAVLSDRVVIDLNGERRQINIPDETVAEMAGVLTVRSEQTGPVYMTSPSERLASDEEVSPDAAGPPPTHSGRGLASIPEATWQARHPADMRGQMEETDENRAADFALDGHGRRLIGRVDPF